MQFVQGSSILQELIQEGFEGGREEGREEGLEEGLEKGERKATIEALHQILAIRFSIEAGQFDEQLDRFDIASLKKLHEVALLAQNLEKFEEALVDMRSKLGYSSSQANGEQPGQ
jgi:flagellar biosynthesis/type III secretory pathway protein FliH